MLFYTPEFLIFSLVLLGFLAIFQRSEPRKIILLVASYVFYMWWNPAFILLILFATAVNYVAADRIGRSEDPGVRKRWIVTSLVASLGLLGFFKYTGFLLDSTLVLWRGLGFEVDDWTLAITLPVGISFYTFQTLSYSLDVYRGKLEASRSPTDFALFVAFFPQLVAGPIVRASDFMPQLLRPVRLSCTQASYFLVMRGLAKKVLVADNIAVLSDGVFAAPEAFPSIVIWIATVCFAVQIYCDFSGYSDMAIGIARILGFEIPRNFQHPYLAKNPSDFWRRWHISLSSWLRDYLYISLGGNRKGQWNTYRNLMLTMLLGGLWHGASWNFVLWGFLHGLILVVHRGYGDLRKKLDAGYQAASHWLAHAISVVFMQYWVLLTWIAFRVTDFGDMLIAMRKFVWFDFDLSLANIGLGALSMFSTVMLIGAFAVLHAISARFGDIDRYLGRVGLVPACIVSLLMGFAAVMLWPLSEAPFIYFQF